MIFQRYLNKSCYSMKFPKIIFRSLALCITTGSVLCGCVLRTITIDSEPPGAMVYLDDEPIGQTPVTTKFTYYGTRKITLEKTDIEGRLLTKRMTVYEKIKPPYYQYIPLDFFSELILPVKLEDDHYFLYQLEPTEEIPVEERQEEVLRNAAELKERLLQHATH